ncbi:ribosomal RNA-processing protein 7 homolog A-like [Pocillopora verrucosa]|uniref:ribosomal RNA-processing protein 7 homolog A-like n=1 Tax=Pocillopora verrucosa TaxID=203993 RepID=UPI0033411360
MASEVGGFQTICVKFSEKYCSYHYLYFKNHTTRDEDTTKPPNKTLFVVNIPPYCTKGSLKRLFSSCGAIKEVFLVKQPGSTERDAASLVIPPDSVKGFKVGYIVFKKSSSLSAALNLDKSTVRVLSTEKSPVVTGVNKWIEEYHLQYPDTKKLQLEVDEFMAKFDEDREKTEREEAESRNQADDEGWVTVGRGGRNPAAPRLDVTELRERKKRKKKQALLNFYQFQQRETRREHIAHLRKKFDDDKKRIAEMKSARKFRPY